MAAGPDPAGADPERAAEGGAEDLSGVPLLATAATTSFDLGVVVSQSRRGMPCACLANRIRCGQ
jgi:hypothetical protein